jgi:NitT/TauT family transport system permease protein
LGVLIAYTCYKYRRLKRIVIIPVNFLRHISPYCWLPLIIMFAGIGEIAVGIVMLMAMLFNAIVIGIGIFSALPVDVLESASLDGAYGMRLIRYIELPLLYESLIDLFRVLWSVGWTALIAAEMLGVQSGMGYRLLDFRYLLMYKEMLAYIAIIGTIGIITDYLFLSWQKTLKNS